MRWSKILYIIAWVSTILGVFSFIFAQVATMNESFLGFSEEYLFNDAKT